ncbi:MAG: methylated-DNA--[protein]-cysteine S-methyltransferase [Deltaproteobacteria bacterium]|nr:MAG: methylated-DNA--[protein]-cysteine S-methyltransferase [Deltaproteobacteria bacterium]
MQVVLPERRKDLVIARIRSRYPDSLEGGKGTEGVQRALKRFFSGKRVDFDFPLDLSPYSDFQRRVWEVARTIPYGEVRSYQWVGSKLGNPRGGRAVGGALGRNPVPVIVPCHRVIRKDGHLGGFSGPGGIELKRKLLKLEGCRLNFK